MTPFTIGLTGSIGMGKTTTAAMFAEAGVPVWDADAAVHRAYAKGGAAVSGIQAICPDAIVGNSVDRSVLKSWIGSDPDALRQIESVVHPIVAQDRKRFLADSDAPIVLLDIPLLFETRVEDQFDVVVVVSAPPGVQRQRVLARGTMTAAQFESILAKQMPDAEKRAKADYVIETRTLEDARTAVQLCLQDIRDRVNARNRSGHGDHGV